MWTDFTEQLKQQLGNPAGLAKWAETSLPELHQQMLSNAQYQNELALAKSKPLERYSESVTLFESPYIKASMVALEKGRPLPLHDHPGASGIMLVIKGEVSVFHCDAEQPQAGKPLVLNVVELRNLQVNEVSWFTVNEKNIHSVNAVSQRAVLMVIHTPKFSAQQQSFYFPLTGQIKAGSRVHAHRINANAFSNTRQQAEQYQQSHL